MKKESIFRFVRTGVLVAMSAIVLTSCKKDPPADTPNDTKGTTITIAGTASTGVPENSKQLKEDNGIYSYAGGLSSGELTLKTLKDGKSRFLYITGNDTGVSTSGSARATERGYYEFEIDLAKNTFSMKKKVEFGSDDVYLSGGDVFMPRTKNNDLMPAMENDGEGGFVYEYSHYLGAGAFHLYLQNDKTKASAYKDADGKVVFLSKDEDKTSEMTEWSIAEAGGYKISVNVMTREATVTPETFFPDNVANLYIVGNAFGNGGADPAAVDASLTAAGSNGAVRMNRSTTDTDVFSITKDLTVAQGGIWFLFQDRHSVPAFIKDGATTGKFFYTASATEADDTTAANQWTVTEDGNYTITVNIKTKEVTVVPTTPHVSVIPAGYDLYVAGDAATGIAEDARKFIVDEYDNSLVYDKVLNAGDLTLVAKKAGADDIVFYLDDTESVISKTGTAKTAAKAFNKITVNPEDGAFTFAQGVAISDNIYIRGAHTMIPRHGVDNMRCLMAIPASTDKPFEFIFNNRFFYVNPTGGEWKQFEFYLNYSLDVPMRIGDAGDGNINKGVESLWKLTETGDFSVKIDLASMKYEITNLAATGGLFTAENLQTVWVFGNTLTSQKTYDGGKTVEDMVNEDAPVHIDQYMDGEWMDGRDASLVVRYPMTKAGAVYTLTNVPLEVAKGGIWFLLKERSSLPSILKGEDGKAYYYVGETGLAGSSDGAPYSSKLCKDCQYESHWTVDEDGIYTITLNIETGVVTFDKTGEIK